MARNINLKGDKYGKLSVIEQDSIRFIGGRNRIYWKCQCECGNIIFLPTDKLRSGHTRSCGCLRGSPTHKLSQTALYHVWVNMIDRCNSESHKSFCHYGARGIKVCEEWQNSIEVFFKWAMENGYEIGLELDRTDNDGDYHPSNCRWVNPKENQRNKRNNVLITYNNTTKAASEWAEMFQMPATTIRVRFKKGLPADKVFSKERINKKSTT